MLSFVLVKERASHNLCSKNSRRILSFFFKKGIYFIQQVLITVDLRISRSKIQHTLEVRVKMSLRFRRCGDEVDLLRCLSWWMMSLLIMPVSSCFLNSKIRARICWPLLHRSKLALLTVWRTLQFVYVVVARLLLDDQAGRVRNHTIPSSALLSPHFQYFSFSFCYFSYFSRKKSSPGLR